MPLNPAAQKEFLMTSDYPIDKVTYLKEISIPLSSLSFNDITFAHGLTYTPLLQAQWSQDGTWPYAYDENSGPINAGFQHIIDTAVECNSTTISIFNTNNQAINTTVYWRLFGFMPTTVNVDAAFTSNLADPYAINSDNDYPKLFSAGVTAFSSVTGSTETVYHGLGYRPRQVLVWAEDGTKTYWMNSFAYPNPGNNNYCKVGINDILFVRDGLFLSSAVRFHYRIYL
jgi:hypothetical protein